MPSFRRLAPALVATLAMPVAAFAQASVTVLPYAPLYGEAPQSLGDKTADLIVQELRAQDGYKVDGAKAEAGPARKNSGTQEIAQAKRKLSVAEQDLKRGLTLYNQRKMGPAAQAFEKAVAGFVANFEGLDSFEGLSDAYLGVAMARFRLGDEDASFKRLDDLVRVDPRRELDGAEFPNGTKIPPLFVKFHEKARANYFERARGSVRITSTPPGASVLFDGQLIGETPLVASQVLPGDHYVRIVSPGAGAHWATVNLTEGEETKVDASFAAEPTGPLATLSAKLGKNSLKPETAADVAKIGEKAGARWVIFGTLRQTNGNIDVRSWLLRVEDQAVVQLRDTTFDSELLGAPMEIYNLTNDFNDKVADFQGVALRSELIPFPDARAPKTDDAFVVVDVTGKAPAVAQTPGDARGGGRRGPVRAAVEQPRAPVTPPTAKTPEPAEEPGPRRLRVRGKIGEEDATTAPVAPRAEPRIEPKPAANDRLALALEEDEPAPVDLKARTPDRRMAALDPEELARLQGIEDDKKKSNIGKIALWSGVGVVGAGAVATGLYFLLSSSAPESATAHVSWNP